MKRTATPKRIPEKHIAILSGTHCLLKAVAHERGMKIGALAQRLIEAGLKTGEAK